VVRWGGVPPPFKKEADMEKQTCEFYLASDLFKDCPTARDLFVESGPECDWGNNNRTLVVAELIYNSLGQDDSDDIRLVEELKMVTDRIMTIGWGTYIDLEN
jgi:hypothetical protein